MSKLSELQSKKFFELSPLEKAVRHYDSIEAADQFAALEAVAEQMADALEIIDNLHPNFSVIEEALAAYEKLKANTAATSNG